VAWFPKGWFSASWWTRNWFRVETEIPPEPEEGGNGVTIEMLRTLLGRRRAGRREEDVAAILAALEAGDEL
jgi:hypothetical protein